MYFLIFLVGVISLFGSDSSCMQQAATNLDLELRKAVKKCDLSLVTDLLDRGASVNAVSKGGATPLLIASSLGDIRICRKLLQSKAELNQVLEDGSFALYSACKSGSPDLVKLLLESRAQGDLRKNDGYGPLHIAAQQGHLAICEILLQYKAPIDTMTFSNETPLVLAQKYNHTAIVALIKKRKSLKEPVQPQDLSLERDRQLRRAAFDGDLAKCKVLLEHGAKVNSRGRSQTAALYVAAQEGHKRVCSLLLDRKAGVDVRRSDGATPLFIASQNGHVETAQLLLAHKAVIDLANQFGATPLFTACKKNHCSVVELLLGRGARDDLFENSSGFSPLHVACEQGNSEIVLILLNYQTPTDCTDKKGRTPFNVALQYGHRDICALLKKNETEQSNLNSQLRHAAFMGDRTRSLELLFSGASVYSAGRGGVTPLHAAATKGSVGVCEILLERRAQVNAQQDDGATPLFLACQNGHKEVLLLLVHHGAPCSLRRTDGTSPLHIASVQGFFNVCRELIYSKAHLESRINDTLRTPLHCAAIHGSLECAQVLLEAGALVDVNDQLNETPLMYAAQGKDADMVRLLVHYGASYQAGLLSSKKKRECVRYVEKVLSLPQEPLAQLRVYGNIDHISDPSQMQRLLEPSDKPSDYTKIRSALYVAARTGDSDSLEMIIRFGVPVDLVNEEGYTPLHLAVRAGHYILCSELLKYGADRNITTPHGETAVQVAKRCGHKKIVTLLESSPVYLQGAVSTTALNKLADKRDSGYAQLPLGNVINYAEIRSAFSTAAQAGNCITVERILGLGVPVDLLNDDGYTPLHLAVFAGHVEICSTLLNYGADTSMQTPHGETALEVARRLCHTEIAALLENSSAYLHGALSSSDANNLVNNSASEYSALPPDQQKYYEEIRSTLHGVAQVGDWHRLEMILGFGVSIDQLNDEGYTPLHLAVLEGHYEMCSALLNYGADVSIQTPHGETPLEVAKRMGRTEIVTLLESKQVNQQGAVSSTHRPIIKEVAQYRALPPGRPKNYEEILSTLHKAAQTGDCEKLEMIFGFGVSVDQLNADGFTALHLAVLGGHYAMCVELLKYGADKSIQTPEGETVLQIAQRIGNKKLVELLDSASS